MRAQRSASPAARCGSGMDAEPGQQEAGADEGLEEDPQVGEPVLPTGIVGPGRMLTRFVGWQCLA